ncbi:G-protein coupled receptor 83 isoform X2 [Nematostella vectensis]|uniref:G-protein coupled receptor 83 isoform X2 n=1 Tax=Nematostella vectensis TaxID=45351 RepID=UPI00138FC238|nr:G-protein coupled receptor 83 isoform X2 [Nematostella vectensis]
MSREGGTATEDVFKLVACGLVGVLSLVGNILFVVVVFKAPRLKTATFYLLVNMSVSDLLFTCISMPPFMVNIMGLGLLVGGSAGIAVCKLLNSSTFGLMASSVLTMTAIAFDRYIAIIKPMRNIMNMCILKCIIVIIWVLSLVFMIPLFFVYDMSTASGTVYCVEDWSTLMPAAPQLACKIYIIALFVIIYIVPFTAMAVMYSSISYELWYREIPGNVNIENKLYVRHKRRKVVLMLVLVLVVFIICWLPLQLVTFLLYFSSVQVSGAAVFTVEFLVRANGALNPVLPPEVYPNIRRSRLHSFYRKPSRFYSQMCGQWGWFRFQNAASRPCATLAASNHRSARWSTVKDVTVPRRSRSCRLVVGGGRHHTALFPSLLHGA